jgi:hypothetical protein
VVDIDIPIEASLQDLFNIPPCEVLKLPQPSPLQLQLPSGGSLNALVDISKGVPTDCSMSFSLMLQLAPLLVAIECPMRVLKLLQPLVDIVKDIPTPNPADLKKFAEAAVELLPCFATLAGIPAFIKDILCLIRAILNCLVGQIQSIRNLMNGLSLRFEAAEGNPDLLAALECAQENATATMANLTQAIDPIAAVLALASPLMEIAGMDLSIEIVPPAGEPSDLAAIDALIATLQGVVDAIDTATAGACGA